MERGFQWWHGENQPAVASIDGRESKHIAEEGPVRFRILRVNHDVRAVDQWQTSGLRMVMVIVSFVRLSSQPEPPAIRRRTSSVLNLCILTSAFAIPLHSFYKLANANDGAAHGAAANFLGVVVRRYSQHVEALIRRFQHRLGPDVRADAARGTVLDVDRGPHGNLIALAVRLERKKGRGLHQPDHVGSGINRRQFGMVRGQCMFELDSLLRLAARPDRDLLRHADRVVFLSDPTGKEPMTAGDAAEIIGS